LLLPAAPWVEAQRTTTSGFGCKPGPAKRSWPTTSRPAATGPTDEQNRPSRQPAAWDGQQLTIDADNSRLAYVLLAVRDRTGGSIENPGSRLGGASVPTSRIRAGTRHPIVSVVRTSLDYIIEAADVILTPSQRGVERATWAIVRTMWWLPEQRIRVREAVAEAGPPGAVAQRGEATGSRARLRRQIPLKVPGRRTSASTSDSEDPSRVGQAIQSMTRRFAQRRQIQAQQNQLPPASSIEASSEAPDLLEVDATESAPNRLACTPFVYQSQCESSLDLVSTAMRSGGEGG
jgi:hypothetical protein